MADLSNFDLTYRFDENLREVFNQPEEVREACKVIRAELKAGTTAQAPLLAQLGTFLRILGNVEEAEYCLQKSLSLLQAERAPAARVIAGSIRLAHAYQWQKRFVEAAALFVTAVDEARKLEDGGEMESFALQHLGKNFFDQGRFDEASANFRKALEIRVRLKKSELADSSQLALERSEFLRSQKKN